MADISLNGCGSIGPHLSGNPKLIVSGMPACTVGSIGFYSNLLTTACLSPGPYVIVSGSPKLLVSGLPVARILDIDTDAGLVMTGSPKLVVP
jgi:uncharacterized Zn-binding protein involved in type VI secretion